MKTLDVEELTTKAVKAALAVIDDAMENTTTQGPCGDALANSLHKCILHALREQFAHPDLAPAFIRMRLK